MYFKIILQSKGRSGGSGGGQGWGREGGEDDFDLAQMIISCTN